jgi:Ni,Fe-hydrogenase I large subunit
LGLEVDLTERRFREAKLRAERVQQHAFQLFLAWPGLTGHAPQSQALRRLREATHALWTTGWWRLEVPLFAWDEPSSVAALATWAQQHEELPAQLIRYLFDHQLTSAGQSEVPLAPSLSDDWFLQHAQHKDFLRHPALDGAPREVGPLARLVDHPLVGDVLRSCGAGLLARFTARLVTLADDLRWLSRAQRLRPVKLRKLPPRSGRGAAVVDSVRGPLAHVVEVTGGRVAWWTVVSPWQWNFHPQGALVGALMGTSASGLQERTRWLVAGLDPCVTCHVVVRGPAGA